MPLPAPRRRLTLSSVSPCLRATASGAGIRGLSGVSPAVAAAPAVDEPAPYVVLEDENTLRLALAPQPQYRRGPLSQRLGRGRSVPEPDPRTPAPLPRRREASRKTVRGRCWGRERTSSRGGSGLRSRTTSYTDLRPHRPHERPLENISTDRPLSALLELLGFRQTLCACTVLEAKRPVSRAFRVAGQDLNLRPPGYAFLGAMPSKRLAARSRSVGEAPARRK
jgi:hypothetical protein